MEYFVEVLKEHADDENRKSLLQDLAVEVRLGNGAHYMRINPSCYISQPPADSEKYMFGLESLASLRGIKDVEISGVPEWYAKSLQLCIQGNAGEVQEVNWPLIEVKRRRGGSTSKTIKGWVTTRKWYQPMLNWKEFAERNGITIPEDIDKFWVADN